MPVMKRIPFSRFFLRSRSPRWLEIELFSKTLLLESRKPTCGHVWTIVISSRVFFLDTTEQKLLVSMTSANLYMRAQISLYASCTIETVSKNGRSEEGKQGQL